MDQFRPAAPAAPDKRPNVEGTAAHQSPPPGTPDAHPAASIPAGTLRIMIDVLNHFTASDGWAIASHIALSTLTSLFPFLIFVTALAGLFGSRYLAEEAARILLGAWPPEVASPIASVIGDVLTMAHGDVLTIGAVFAVYFASSGIESLRIGLNRAYGVPETRGWWLLRLESIAYVLVGAGALLALSLLVVLGPLILATAMRYAHWIEPYQSVVTFARYAVTSVVLILALILVHLFLPAGRRTFRQILPGVIMTLVLWLLAGAAFGRYLAEFAVNYVTTYAGLASAMIALIFLYLTAAIFLFGGELNAAIIRARRDPPKPAPAESSRKEN